MQDGSCVQDPVTTLRKVISTAWLPNVVYDIHVFLFCFLTRYYRTCCLMCEYLWFVCALHRNGLLQRELARIAYACQLRRSGAATITSASFVKGKHQAAKHVCCRLSPVQLRWRFFAQSGVVLNSPATPPCLPAFLSRKRQVTAVESRVRHPLHLSGGFGRLCRESRSS